MAAPVISPIQSILYSLQWEPMAFQPYASNSPTAWNVTPLPAGITFNPATGFISGAVEMPGVYGFAFTAINADGASAPKLFTWGVEASTFTTPVPAVDMAWDMASGLVTVPEPADENPTVNAALNANAEPLKPLLWLKRGDARIINLRPLKGGVVLDILFATLKLTFKAREPEVSLFSATVFERVGTGAETYYRLAVNVGSGSLDGEMSNVEDDAGTQFVCLAEFETTVAQVAPAGGTVIGDATLRITSLNFAVGVARDMIPNA